MANLHYKLSMFLTVTDLDYQMYFFSPKNWLITASSSDYEFLLGKPVWTSSWTEPNHWELVQVVQLWFGSQFSQSHQRTKLNQTLASLISLNGRITEFNPERHWIGGVVKGGHEADCLVQGKWQLIEKEYELNEDCPFHIKYPIPKDIDQSYTCSSVQCGP